MAQGMTIYNNQSAFDKEMLDGMREWIEPRYETLIQQVKALHPNLLFGLGDEAFYVFQIVAALEATHAGVLSEDEKTRRIQSKLLNLRAL